MQQHLVIWLKLHFIAGLVYLFCEHKQKNNSIYFRDIADTGAS